MTKENLFFNVDQKVAKEKEKLRLLFLQKRKRLSFSRRREAAHNLAVYLGEKLSPFSRVLSFLQMPSEIDLSFLHSLLLYQKKVLFPAVEKEDICAYRVDNLDTQLVKHPILKFWQPNSTKCERIPAKAIDCILVPGIVFDANNNRLGYGKGLYDRLMQPLSCPFWGIGFQEQWSQAPLPVEPHDVSLSRVFLF